MIRRVLVRWDLLVSALGLGLVFWLNRDLDAQGLRSLLSRLGPGLVLAYLALNLLLGLALADRWWLLLRRLGTPVAFSRLAGHRLAAAAVSLLTPGPQFGGEPLQVHLLVRREAAPPDRAVASVALDRALELTANFAFLLVGVIYVLWSGLFGAALDWRGVALAGLLLSLPLAFLAASRSGAAPLSKGLRAAASALSARWERRLEGLFLHHLEAGEQTVHRLLRERPWVLVEGLLVSGLNWAVLFGEFWFAASIVGLSLDPGEVLTMLTAARIAILLPAPAALGPLEASQVLVLDLLGLPPAHAIGLLLLIRLRDALLIGLGLLFFQRRTHVMNAQRTSLTSIQIGVVVLTLITALIHLALGFPFGDSFGILFLLNGLGYIALVAGLYFLPQLAGRRSQVRWALMAYTGVTIILWLVMNGDFTNLVGIFTKAVELALIVLLYLDRSA